MSPRFEHATRLWAPPGGASISRPALAELGMIDARASWIQDTWSPSLSQSRSVGCAVRQAKGRITQHRRQAASQWRRSHVRTPSAIAPHCTAEQGFVCCKQLPRAGETQQRKCSRGEIARVDFYGGIVTVSPIRKVGIARNRHVLSRREQPQVEALIATGPRKGIGRELRSRLYLSPRRILLGTVPIHGQHSLTQTSRFPNNQGCFVENGHQSSPRACKRDGFGEPNHAVSPYYRLDCRNSSSLCHSLSCT